jgi:uncharacterized protein
VIRSLRHALSAIGISLLLLMTGHGNGTTDQENLIPNRYTIISITEMTAEKSYTSTAKASTPDPDPTELAEDVQMAVTAVNGYWAAHFEEVFGRSYHPPQVLGVYTQNTAPTCGTERAPMGNALYCDPPEDYVAWAADLLLRGVKEGDGWVYLVVAHEWGHAIQARVNEDLVTVDRELQADCLAAVALYGAARDGTLKFESGDERELTNALAENADQVPWTNSRDHGDAQERIEAFRLGRDGGVRACFPSRS